MSAEVVNAYDQSVLLVGEASWGVPPDPAAAQAIEMISLKTGPSERGNFRGKKDRNPGRGLQNAFVEGRVQPIDFVAEASVKSRAAADTVPRETVLMKAAGLLETVNAATSVVYSLPADPLMSSTFVSASLYRILGKTPYVLAAEQLRGCLVKTLTFEGGDKELMIKAAGAGIGKYVSGYLPSVTFASGVDTAITCLAGGDIYYLQLGFYQIESEIIKITAISTTGNSFTAVRAQLGSTGAAHATKPIRPYQPSLTYAGSPVSEAVCSGTLDSIALEYLSFMVELTTGADHKPPESGSRYSQGAIFKRYDVKARFKALLRREDVRFINKSVATNSVPLSFVSGGTAGGIVTFSMPYCVIEPIEIPDSANDVVNVDVSVMVRDSAGNDALTIAYT